ncbi:ribonuclease III [Patescibacteria group bacterium]|nr:ribonuclease III [Patescibacteria group bacterium]
MTKIPEFKNKKLFKQAFVHRSYINESKEKLESNERLEFLGDSVISFIISSYLYKTFPDFNEGVLTNLRSLLVNTKILAEVSKELNFGKHLMLSKGEEESMGRENQSLLADSFEAFVGALFLDQGINVTTEFLCRVLIPKADEFVKNKSFKDPKSLLQEKVQAKKLSSPLYKVIKEEGPAHAKKFTVGVYVDSKLFGIGNGRSKQDAEEMAAKEALERKGK